MNSFYLNGLLWQVEFVEPFNPMLYDRTGNLTVATTDPILCKIYMLRTINGGFRRRVLCHELGHAAMISYNLLDDIHRMVKPKYWIEMEEWICNFIADYGLSIFNIAYSILGDSALGVVSNEIDNLFSKGG